MEGVARCRQFTREMVADVEPPRLQSAVLDGLEDVSALPAALAIASADALGGDGTADTVLEQAAGVQLVYAGLALTRTLVHEEPWPEPATGTVDGTAATDGSGVMADREVTDGDVDILAADVMVARGFTTLTEPTASAKVVETARSFGRDQTRRSEPGADRDALDENLERKVLELAVVVGALGADAEPTAALFGLADDLVADYGTVLPAPAEVRARLPTTPADPVPSEDVGTDRATSATDP